MDLTVVWFVIIAFLWIGYFVLEGFDFGVGMLMPILGRSDRERRVVINTIGPHFDANEVWVHRCRWCDVRRLSRVVRDAVQRFLPSPAADPGRADPAAGRHRLPQQAS